MSSISARRSSSRLAKYAADSLLKFGCRTVPSTIVGAMTLPLREILAEGEKLRKSGAMSPRYPACHPDPAGRARDLLLSLRTKSKFLAPTTGARDDNSEAGLSCRLRFCLLPM